jgi:hypothetical protein
VNWWAYALISAAAAAATAILAKVGVQGVPSNLATASELVPVRGTRFSVKGRSGLSLEFKRDAHGKVIEAAVYDVEGNFVARKTR